MELPYDPVILQNLLVAFDPFPRFCLAGWWVFCVSIPAANPETATLQRLPGPSQPCPYGGDSPL